MISSLGAHAFRAITPQTAVTVDRSRCVRHRCKRNECSKCIEVCPTGTLSWGESGLQIKSSACTRCLSCLAVCPSAALKPPELSLAQLLSDLASHSSPVLGCRRHSASDAHVTLSCLGYLAHPELMLLLALVFEAGLQLNMTQCSECSSGHIVESIQAAHARLPEFRPDHRLKLVSDPNELDCRPATMSRRELFQLFRNRSSRTAGVLVKRLQGGDFSQSFGAKQLPQVRGMLLKLAVGLPDERRQQIVDRLFGKVSFTTTCTACNGCVGICSTGAIQPAEGDDKVPGFSRDLCVRCGSCEAFCLKDGVLLEQ